MDGKLPTLLFPDYPFRVQKSKGELKIFDNVRKKFVALTPEEWVRQHVIMYLNKDKGFPLSRLSVEQSIKINHLNQRADLLFYDKYRQPLLVVECKAPNVKISQKVFDQAVRYNYVLKVRYILVTNGMSTYCCEVDYDQQICSFLKDVPAYNQINDG